MRLYVKLVLMVALFAGLASTTGRRMTGALAYEARVGFVCVFGSQADYAALADDTDYMVAKHNGSVDLYRAGQRFRQLLAKRMAEAGRRSGSVSDDDAARIYAECVRDALEGHGPSGSGAAVTNPMTSGPAFEESAVPVSRPRPGAQSQQ